MKVCIDLDKCYKSGECYYNHPELFKMGEAGYPVILVEDLAEPALREHAQQAADVCPAVAISVVTD